MNLPWKPSDEILSCFLATRNPTVVAKDRFVESRETMRAKQYEANTKRLLMETRTREMIYMKARQK